LYFYVQGIHGFLDGFFKRLSKCTLSCKKVEIKYKKVALFLAMSLFFRYFCRQKLSDMKKTKIIAREAEMAELKRCYESDRSELVIV
jgi:hypothetical protein